MKQYQSARAVLMSNS